MLTIALNQSLNEPLAQSTPPSSTHDSTNLTQSRAPKGAALEKLALRSTGLVYARKTATPFRRGYS
jgi:hypothetical protein